MSEEIDSHVLAKYKVNKKIGSGAYGHVWKVTDRKAKGYKALKKNFDAFSNSTDAQRTYREIMFLQQLKHPNIINLEKIIKATNDKDIYLIFEYMDVDLHTLVREGNILQEKHKKYIIYQIAKALFFLHNSDIIHRDLKPSNILVNEECDAKICDFGLVRLLEEPDNDQIPIMTDYIATRWYRAPELLLGCHQYSKQIDIWSLGCMVGEIMKGKPLFPGNSTINQLQKILTWTGPPTSKEIKNIKQNISQNILDLLNSKKKINKAEIIPSMANNEAFFDFISKMLEFDPAKRIDIEGVLKHPYLSDFYKPREIEEIKRTQVNLKLHINDNIKLTIKDYRGIIYKEVDRKNGLEKLKTDDIEINVHQIKKTNDIMKRMPTEIIKDPHQESKMQSKYSVLKESKTLGNKRNPTKDRSMSRKKGISLCSKQIENQRKNENVKHHRSFIGNVSHSSNERYRCIASKESSLPKKQIFSQVKKKVSYGGYIVTATKLTD